MASEPRKEMYGGGMGRPHVVLWINMDKDGNGEKNRQATILTIYKIQHSA